MVRTGVEVGGRGRVGLGVGVGLRCRLAVNAG